MSRLLKVTVCELSQEENDFQKDWAGLVDHVQSHASDLVLLPEMIFCPWFAANKPFDISVWNEAVSKHEKWMERLQDLAPAIVAGSRPVIRDGRRHNESFVWDTDGGLQSAHTKIYLPDEEGFWEATWYQPGESGFSSIEIKGIHIGLALCTDIWFFQHAREYGKQGVHLLLHPRATQRVNLDKWLVAGRTASVVAGAFCLSSNHVSPRGTKPELGGMGWVTSPDGDVLRLTSRKGPFQTVTIDLKEAESAKSTYPRYVLEPGDHY